MINAAQTLPPGDLKEEFTQRQPSNPVPDPLSIPKACKPNTKIIHFPISLANCGTLDGNMKVLQEFSETLQLKTEVRGNVLRYNSKNATYDLQESRERVLFLERVQKVMNEQLLEQNIFETEQAEEDQTADTPAGDNLFEMKYNELRQRLFNAKNVQGIIQELGTDDIGMVDTYGRTFLHAAVETNDVDMFNLVTCIGCNPNVQEKTGLTPLCIAVIKGNSSMVLSLLELGANCKIAIPSAYDLAEELGENHITGLFNDYLQASSVSTLYDYCGIVRPLSPNSSNVKDHESSSGFDRCSVLTPVFGDNGVEKLVRSVKTRSGGFKNFCECPGDMHASAYACECVAKTLGPGGMYYCLKHTLNRKNDSNTFGSTKFQEDNMQTNEEACRDVCMGYGLAAYRMFEKSEFFPSQTECMLNSNTVLLDRFRLFINDCSSSNKCKYYLQAVVLFGPWLNLYKKSVRNGYGFGREVVWLLGILIYGPMQKKNYYASAMVHCINLLYKWPKFVRDVISAHFSVSVKGKCGHDIANDEYVETYLVRPLKMYCTGHTTVKMLQKLSVSSQIIKHVRDAYVEGFSFRRSRDHKVPDSLVDQVKVALFCIEHGFFTNDSESVKLFDENGITERNVPKSLLDVQLKGQQMLASKFSSKMYTYYEECRSKLC